MNKPTAIVLEVAAVAGLVLLVMWLLSGCAGLPADYAGTPGEPVPDVPYYFPFTSTVAFSAAPAGDPTAPSLLDAILGFAGKAAGIYAGGAGVLALLTPKGRSNLANVAKPSSSWAGTLQSVGAILNVAHTPAEALQPKAG